MHGPTGGDRGQIVASEAARAVGIPEFRVAVRVAIEAVFPRAIVQTCIFHLIRDSLEFVSWADRKLVVPQLRAIYRARDADAGMALAGPAKVLKLGIYASGKRFRPSTTAMRMLPTRRFLSSFITLSQNLRPRCLGP
jgi:hypothetical protein